MIQSLLVFSDWTILLMRLALGLVFIIHGWDKLKDLNSTFNWFSENKLKPGWLWGSIVTFIEFVGGIMLILGLMTQVVAVILAIMVLIFLVHKILRKQKFINGIDLTITLLAGLLLLASLGNGFFSLNNYFRILF